MVPTGRINVPQANISPPNGGFSVPKQMQSGLNANQYTSQMRILDVDDNRSGYQKVNDVAISKTPWEKLQPYSLICIGGSDQFWIRTGTATLSINPNDRPLSGCVLEYLMDEATSKPKDYTAFERGAMLARNGPDTGRAGAIPSLIANVNLGATMKDVAGMKDCGFLLPNKTLTQLKKLLTSMTKAEVTDLATTRIAMGDRLDETGFFNKFFPDSTVISTTLGDGDEALSEIDQASGFSTFGTKIQGHAFVSQCTSKLKCHIMDTVYVVIRAQVAEVSGKSEFTKPEMCFLTSGQMKQAFRDITGDMDAKLNSLGDQIRNMMTKSVGVTRSGNANYVVLGGWKLGKVVDVHAIPVGRRQSGFGKGLSIYEIMLNIERCTALDLIRHIM